MNSRSENRRRPALPGRMEWREGVPGRDRITQRLLFAQTIRVERNGGRDEPGNRLGCKPSGRCQCGDGLRDTRTNGLARRLNFAVGDGRSGARVMDLNFRRTDARDRAGQRAQECGKKKKKFHQGRDVVAKPSRVQTPRPKASPGRIDIQFRIKSATLPRPADRLQTAAACFQRTSGCPQERPLFGRRPIDRWRIRPWYLTRNIVRKPPHDAAHHQ